MWLQGGRETPEPQASQRGGLPTAGREDGRGHAAESTGGPRGVAVGLTDVGKPVRPGLSQGLERRVRRMVTVVLYPKYLVGMSTVNPDDFTAELVLLPLPY